jgi:AcrR family transcriptional regulator
MVGPPVVVLASIVVRQYHDRMTIPRQPPQPTRVESTGRVNQKQRTRRAIVEAAIALMDDGTTPTVARAAEAALVSRTTAYRYFPTQESLLLELTLHADVDHIEALVAEPLDADRAVERSLEVLRRFNQHVLDEEARYRNALRMYQELWFDAAAAGDAQPILREGRRMRWFRTTLAPLRERAGDEAIDRLVLGLSALAGMEAMTALRDVCRLSAEDALDVTEWAARALVDASLP